MVLVKGRTFNPATNYAKTLHGLQLTAQWLHRILRLYRVPGNLDATVSLSTYLVDPQMFLEVVYYNYKTKAA